MLISFISFFISSFSFAINCALEITFEMIAPLGDSESTQNFYSCCMFVLLGCTLFLVCFVFSLFWEIVKIVVVKRSLKFRVGKVVLLFIILLSAGVCTAFSKTNFVEFMDFIGWCLIVASVVAFILAVLGSLGLLLFLYKEESHESYALTLLPMRIPFVLFSILTPVSFKLVDASTGAMCFAFFYPFLTACLALYVCFRGCRKPNGEYFIIRRRFALLFMVAYLVVLVLAISSRAPCGAECKLTLSANATKETTNMQQRNENRVGYPICGKTWSSLQLNVADMAFLSYLAYDDKWRNQDLGHAITSYFHNKGGNWNVTYVSNGTPAFFHLVESTKKVHVISISGAQTMRDWFDNLKLWSEIFTYQVTSVALPVQRLPLNFVALYVSAASSLERLLHGNHVDVYFRSVESYLRGINRTEAESVLLTGHSLGGGLAKIVASRNRFEAVSFSSPGELCNHVKLGYLLEDVQTHTTSVVAHSDMVTWVDVHGGLVQHITCDGGGYRRCHSIDNTYCELKTRCSFETPVLCDEQID